MKDATLEAPLPWLARGWEILTRARAVGRLPHALLLTGPAGVGKRRLAARFAHALLCPSPDERGAACGRCRSCELFAAGTHPDYVKVGPDPNSKSDEIKVDAVRELNDASSLTAHRGGYKVVVLDPAQNINLNAANSLLKTLEEPSGATLLCLICEQPERLLATIRSRCQELKIALPAEPTALRWLRERTNGDEVAVALRLCNGAPLEALALLEEGRLSARGRCFEGFVEVAAGHRDPISEASAWNEHEPALMLSWLSGWVSDLLRLASGHPDPRLINVDKAGELRRLSRLVDTAAAHRFLRLVFCALEHDQVVINRPLLYESLLIRWAEITCSGQVAFRRKG